MKLDKIAKYIIWAAAIVIVFSIIAPWIFVQKSSWGIDFDTSSGVIGDTIGGIMNPFIALSGVLITFLAFYIQFLANRMQREHFEKQLKEDRDRFKDDLNFQKHQSQLSQFENQFYEMIAMHKGNVDDIQIAQKLGSGINEIKGRNAFILLKDELELSYLFAKLHFPDANYKVWMNEAYNVFFIGITKEDIGKHDFFKDLQSVKDNYKNSSYKFLSQNVQEVSNSKIEFDKELGYAIFEGHSPMLAHYYRHLFLTVKFVVNQSEDFLSYEEKRKYLRMLRAQLANYEQVMLFYNWLSAFGKQWLNDNNKFLTDYRMIHNIYQSLLLDGINLEEIFDVDKGYRIELNRIKDTLFEYQDW